jgi:hypothetical protein
VRAFFLCAQHRSDRPDESHKTAIKTAWALALALASSLLLPAFTTARAETSAAVIEEMAAHLEFSRYRGGVIFAKQIPREHWKHFLVINTRDAAQYTNGHTPGAININWRQVLAQSTSIPRDKLVLGYCNASLLSAQVGFALCVARL